MFWGPLPVKNQSSRRQGAGQMGSRIWASLLIRLEKVAWTMTQVWTFFDFPTWNTTKSQSSPTGAGNLPPVELETRTNSCWGKLAPRENKRSACPCSVLPPNHQIRVALPCGRWMRVRERRRLQLLPRSRSYSSMRQASRRGRWERGYPESWSQIRPMATASRGDTRAYTRWELQQALLLESEESRSRCLLLSLWTLVS